MLPTLDEGLASLNRSLSRRSHFVLTERGIHSLTLGKALFSRMIIPGMHAPAIDNVEKIVTARKGKVVFISSVLLPCP